MTEILACIVVLVSAGGLTGPTTYEGKRAVKAECLDVQDDSRCDYWLVTYCEEPTDAQD